MLRICRLLPRRKMAACIPAIGCRNLQIVVTTYVTTGAGNIGMPVRQREADRGSRVVHGSSEPTVERVARLAGLRELRLHVVGDCCANRLRAVQVRLVTADASCRQTLKLADSGALVTVIALYGGVGS